MTIRDFSPLQNRHVVVVLWSVCLNVRVCVCAWLSRLVHKPMYPSVSLKLIFIECGSSSPRHPHHRICLCLRFFRNSRTVYSFSSSYHRLRYKYCCGSLHQIITQTFVNSITSSPAPKTKTKFQNVQIGKWLSSEKNQFKSDVLKWFENCCDFFVIFVAVWLTQFFF